MKQDIHPSFYPEAQVTCMACGKEWTVGATYETMRVDICANCHPFYTGEQRIVDTEGQVDRFMKRLQERDRRRAEVETRETDGDSDEVSTSAGLEVLELSARYTDAMEEDGLKSVADVIARLEAEGDEGLTKISGIGRKILADTKKQLRNLGFEIADVD